MAFTRIPLLLALTHLATAAQPSAPDPVPAPLRDIPWVTGGLNFLHTTDTHGWHAGHLSEPEYQADWGDYISFTEHLRRRADEDGSDLLVIDTGDRVEGNGLYDASEPKGMYTEGIISALDIDVITSGNHELYLSNTSRREYEEVVPDFKNSYIASNLDIRGGEDEEGDYGPLAPRYRKFTTKNTGTKILAFGFLFNFHGNADNTRVQMVQETVKEQWFQDAIREKEVDLFLVAGHVPVRDSEEYDMIYKAIRKAAWDTPIVFFGGHTHIRDYRVWENKAQGIESGRYMETLGFLSIADVKKSHPKYNRMYIDNNRFSLQHHSATDDATFDTPRGQNVSTAIQHARRALNLDHTYGCAPCDLWLTRAPYPSPDSMLSWLADSVLPDTFHNSTSRPTIILSNSGALRFDIFRGPFTVDSTFLVSPFTSGFRALRDVPSEAARQVLAILNNEGPITRADLRAFAWTTGAPSPLHGLDDLHPPHALGSGKTAPQPLARRHDVQAPLINYPSNARPRLTPGHKTSDDLGPDGDDTLRAPLPFHVVPAVIGSEVNCAAAEAGEGALEKVDLAYNEFVQSWVLLALRFLGVERGPDEAEVVVGGRSMTDVVAEWVGGNWGCEGGEGLEGGGVDEDGEEWVLVEGGEGEEEEVGVLGRCLESEIEWTDWMC